MSKYENRQRPLAIAISAMLAAGSLQAATITVDSALDGPLATYPTDCTLRAAVEAANTDAVVDGCAAGEAGLDEIVFDSALVNSTITIANSDSPFEVNSPVAISGPLPGDYAGLVVDGNNVSQVFDLAGTADGNIDVVLDSLTVTGGYSEQLGGGIFSNRVNLTLTDVLVSFNYSALGSAGIAAFTGTLALENTVVSQNMTGPLGSGGGIGVRSVELSVQGGQISNNVCSRVGGGGIYANAYSAVTLTDTVVSGNEITNGTGAGIRVGQSELTIYRSVINSNRSVNGSFGFGIGIGGYGSLVTVTDSEVSLNEFESDSPIGGYGGGIGLANSSLLVTGSTISGNRVIGNSYAMGGGVFSRGGDADIRNSRVTGNQADLLTQNNSTFSGGGGLYFQTGSAVISDTEISGNLARGLDQRGGAIGALVDDLAMTNVTMSGNQLDGANDSNEGIGFVLDLRGTGQATLVHVTMADNGESSSATDQSALFREQTVDLTLINALLSNASTDPVCSRLADNHTASLVTDASCTGTAADRDDLALFPLEDNGGLSQTHAIPISSVAVNAAGDCSVLGVLTDQRGVARDAQCDIGAFEWVETIFTDRFESL